MVGGGGAGVSVALQVPAVDEPANGIACPEAHDRRKPIIIEAPENRRHIRNGREAAGQGGPRKTRFAALPETFLGRINQRNHPAIGFLGGFAEGEDAVMGDDDAGRGRVPISRRRNPLGERKSGPDVADHRRRVAERLPAQVLGGLLIGQGQDRVGMAVDDIRSRQKGMQKRFNGRRRRPGRHLGRAQPVDHPVVIQGPPGTQLPQRVQPERREARRLDDRHVPAAALDVKPVFAPHPQFRRAIAAAVQNERGIAAQQPRRINKLTETPGGGSAAPFGRPFLRPTVFHGPGVCPKPLIQKRKKPSRPHGRPIACCGPARAGSGAGRVTGYIMPIRGNGARTKAAGMQQAATNDFPPAGD